MTPNGNVLTVAMWLTTGQELPSVLPFTRLAPSVEPGIILAKFV